MPAYFEETKKYHRPIVTNIYDSSWDLFDRHLYPGGARRIHMLRKMLGDETFWPAVRDYFETFSGKTVETVDFQRMLEKHSGLNLKQFFDQWIYSPGYPQLKVKFNYNKQENLASVKIVQKQENKVNVFAMIIILLACFALLAVILIKMRNLFKICALSAFLSILSFGAGFGFLLGIIALILILMSSSSFKSAPTNVSLNN